MLVLSRKKNERIMIGDHIEVTIVDIRGDRVKLGFVGPNDVPIHREEVFRRMAGWNGLEVAASDTTPLTSSSAGHEWSV